MIFKKKRSESFYHLSHTGGSLIAGVGDDSGTVYIILKSKKLTIGTFPPLGLHPNGDELTYCSSSFLKRKRLFPGLVSLVD